VHGDKGVRVARRWRYFGAKLHPIYEDIDRRIGVVGHWERTSQYANLDAERFGEALQHGGPGLCKRLIAPL
jgi:hypothetical protein